LIKFLKKKKKIQTGGSTLCFEIHRLINSIWNNVELPQQWKESITVPIYKKGDTNDCNNYRGISLLQTTHKILSNILTSRLMSCVYKITGDHQGEFRHNISTTDKIFCIRQTLEKNGHILTDFEKAYNSVRGEVLYNILTGFYMSMKLIRLIKMCLNEI
jgi:sorting nexin-29